MRTNRAIPILALIAIPMALFPQVGMEAGFFRATANAVAMCLVVLAWRIFQSKPLSRIDSLLVRTYLIGFLTLSIWLGLNIVINATYDTSWTNPRNGAIRHYCLTVEPFLVGVGLFLLLFFIILCVARTVTAIRNYYRQTKNLKATHV